MSGRGQAMVVCACCERSGPFGGRGLIMTCYRRHQYAGTLNGFPTKSELIREEYGPMLAAGVGVRDAARRLGVSERTILRHKRALEAAQ